mgnify:CR=1 FL=1
MKISFTNYDLPVALIWWPTDFLRSSDRTALELARVISALFGPSYCNRISFLLLADKFNSGLALSSLMMTSVIRIRISTTITTRIKMNVSASFQGSVGLGLAVEVDGD